MWSLDMGGYSPAAWAAMRATPGIAKRGNVYEGRADAMALFCDALRVRGLCIALLRGLDFDTPELDCPLVWPPDLSELRSYQREGAFFLASRTEAILGDGMRLGKTAQAIAAMRIVNPEGGILVVCPSYVRGVWAAEFDRWRPKHAPIFFPKGNTPAGIDAAIVVIHYDILHTWGRKISEWAPELVVFDEGHLLQSESSLRGQAARTVSAGAKWRWALSGTPLTNRVRDLWNLVDTVSPGRFGKFFDFGLRYCDAHKEEVAPTKTVWKFDGQSNAGELAWRLRHIMLRRLAADVIGQLPPKTRQTIWVETHRPPRGEPTWRTDLNARAIREFLDHAADAKLPAAIDLIAGHLEAGLKVVVYCYRRAVAEHIQEMLDYPTGLIHGGISAARRGAAISQAASAPGAFALVCTIDSTQVGIDLSFADVEVFAELTYEPHELLQAEARGVRYGDPANTGVLIQYVLQRGSVDELIAAKVLEKLDTFEKVVGPTGENLNLTGSAKDAAQEILESLGLS